MTPGVPAFSLRGVEQVRGEVHTLRGVDLNVPAGDVVALVGPSGAGKTSLIRLLNRLDDPDMGTVTYMGTPIGSFRVRELRRHVAFVFQSPVMFAGSVEDNQTLAAEAPAHRDAPRETRGSLRGHADHRGCAVPFRRAPRSPPAGTGSMGSAVRHVHTSRDNSRPAGRDSALRSQRAFRCGAGRSARRGVQGAAPPTCGPSASSWSCASHGRPRALDPEPCTLSSPTTLAG
jgi:hypothetical protein